MELKQIKELMAVMGKTGINRLALKTENFQIELERNNGSIKEMDVLDITEERPNRYEEEQRRTLPKSNNRVTHKTAEGTPSTEETNVAYVTSPMVGTFYASPSPDAPSFIKPGDKVEKNQVVCIIEAMKVMNEVKAGVQGTVLEVLVETGHPVEFGSKLFRIAAS